MKIIKIGAMWCPGCLVMNKIWNNIKNNYEIDILELDYDMDSDKVASYNVGQILPVIIFVSSKGEELERLIGEEKENVIVDRIEKYRGM